ncbi:MAG: hypothetical protein ACYC4Q_09770 [Victivallaceae bacterium]
MKMIDLIPNGHDYCVSKVYEGIYANYALAKQCFDEIKGNCETIKLEIDKRYSPGAFVGIDEVFRKIDYILARLGKWIESGKLHDNKDAEVFMDSFCGRFEELKEMLAEMDADTGE